MRLEFSWDPTKARSNARKHGISFEEAQTAFDDDHARLTHDPDHSDQEDRFLLLGMSAVLHLLVVAHSYREQDAVIRSISARKATKNEQIQYAEFRP